MSHRIKNLFLGFIVVLIVVGSGTVEDWYGRTYYAQDAIGYLDASRAITNGDWTLALTPQWSIGYPLLLAAVRWMFPPGPQGEWTSMHVVNLVIFVLTYVVFLYFLKVASIYTAKVNGAIPGPRAGWNGFVFTIGTSIFLLWQLLIGNISRVSPDPLICGFFFLVTAACLNFFMQPKATTAAVIGLLMGLGYVFKAGFLPASVLTLAVVFFHGLIHGPGNRLSVTFKLAWALPLFVLVSLAYALPLSKAAGTFTFGQSGDINYAWHVNNLPNYCEWQGGPDPFGMPIHPTHLVLKNPPVFTFAEPFHVTYPPWYNIYYFYDGYHRFFSAKNQLAAIKENLSVFRRFFTNGVHSGAKTVAYGIVFVVALFLLKERLTWLRRLLALSWLYLLILIPIGLYIAVHIEPRYVVGPLIALFTVSFLPLFIPAPLISAKGGYALATFVVVASVAFVISNRLDMLDNLIHSKTNNNDSSWLLGVYLNQIGVQPGDKIAEVGLGSGITDTWAFVSGTHIVGEIGNYAYDPDHQKEDLQLFANSPEIQQTVFDLFKQAGAVVVVARDLKQPPQGPGWEPAPDNPEWWIHRL